jgi:hypothetical protein
MYKNVLVFTKGKKNMYRVEARIYDKARGLYTVNDAHHIRTYLLHNPCPNPQKRDITSPSELTSSAKKTPQ